MSRRPLVFVSALTVGDYLLWNWSLNGNHDLLALLAGLTLPPLALACLWLLTLGVARLIGDATRRRPAVADALARRSAPVAAEATGAALVAEQLAGPEDELPASPRKLAA